MEAQPVVPRLVARDYGGAQFSAKTISSLRLSDLKFTLLTANTSAASFSAWSMEHKAWSICVNGNEAFEHKHRV